jgi:hypothetical protein
MILRIFIGLWVVLVLGSLCWGYVVEWLDDVRRGSSGEPPI